MKLYGIYREIGFLGLVAFALQTAMTKLSARRKLWGMGRNTELRRKTMAKPRMLGVPTKPINKKDRKENPFSKRRKKK